MEISKQTWLNYIERLSRLNRTAADKVRAYIGLHGFDDENLIGYAYGIATKYGEGSAALAAEMYDLIAQLSGAALEAAEVAETATYGEVAKAINGTSKTGNAELVSNAIGRLVKRAGADTTIKNAIRDGAYWAWVPNGDTCAFCLTLASRGWQKASKSVLKGDHASHIHANCDCTFAARFNKDTRYESYDPEQYLKMYEDAEGSTPNEKINFLRRQKYQENKDRINAQKRAAYAEQLKVERTVQFDIINKKGERSLVYNLRFFAEKDLKNQSSLALKKGIKSLGLEIERHKDILRDSKQHVPDWDIKTEREQAGLKKHWEKEIQNFNASIQNRIDELKKRGDWHE